MVEVLQSVAIFSKPRARTDPTQRPLCKHGRFFLLFLQIHFPLAFIRESGTFFFAFWRCVSEGQGHPPREDNYVCGGGLKTEKEDATRVSQKEKKNNGVQNRKFARSNSAAIFSFS